MITGIVVGILGFLLALVLYQLVQKSRPALPPGQQRKALEDVANLTIAQARIGDAVSITGAGDQFADLDFTVDRRTAFVSGQKRWSELGGAYRDRRVHVGVEEEEEGLQVWTVLDPRKLTLEDIGLSEEDLQAMDERQNTGDRFEFDGKLWFYRFSRQVAAEPDGSRQPAGQFYCWRFEEEGGKRSLTVRKPESEPFAVEVSSRMNPGDITVFRGR
jgi:hypothetical protein